MVLPAVLPGGAVSLKDNPPLELALATRTRLLSRLPQCLAMESPSRR